MNRINWDKPIEFYSNLTKKWYDAEVVSRNYYSTNKDMKDDNPRFLMVIHYDEKDSTKVIRPSTANDTYWRNKKEKRSKVIAIYYDNKEHDPEERVLSMRNWTKLEDAEKAFGAQDQLVALKIVEVVYYA